MRSLGIRFATALLTGVLVLAPAVSATAAPPAAGQGVAAREAADVAPCRVGYYPRSTSNPFNVDVQITNTGSIGISGWTLTFTLPDGQKLVSVINAEIKSVVVQAVALSDVGWNADVAADASVWIHLVVAGDYRLGTPSDFRVNGNLCDVVTS